MYSPDLIKEVREILNILNLEIAWFDNAENIDYFFNTIFLYSHGIELDLKKSKFNAKISIFAISEDDQIHKKIVCNYVLGIQKILSVGMLFEKYTQ